MTKRRRFRPATLPTLNPRRIEMSDAREQSVNQYLSFELSGENYAIPVTHIREVLLVPKITRIPRMPDFMRGIINLRGSVVPVLDLRLKFGIGETVVSESTAIIVVEVRLGDLEADMLRLGIFTDSVKKVITLGRDDIEPPPKIGAKINNAFILGMGHVDDGFLVILDIKEILTDEDMRLFESVQEQPLEN
jgi:purine-binding chemotaxis protein CheW